MKNKFIFFLLVGSLGFGGSTIKDLTNEQADTQKIDTLTKDFAEIVIDVNEVKGDVKLLNEILIRVEVDAKERSASNKEELKEIKTLLLNMRRQ